MNYEQAILGLQDNLSRLAEIGRLQTKIIESHSQTLLLHDENQRLLEDLAREHTRTLIAHESMLRANAAAIESHEKYQRQIEQNLSEITDKLNGLIGCMDDLRPPSVE